MVPSAAAAAATATATDAGGAEDDNDDDPFLPRAVKDSKHALGGGAPEPSRGVAASTATAAVATTATAAAAPASHPPSAGEAKDIGGDDDEGAGDGVDAAEDDEGDAEGVEESTHALLGGRFWFRLVDTQELVDELTKRSYTVRAGKTTWAPRTSRAPSFRPSATGVCGGVHLAAPDAARRAGDVARVQAVPRL